MYVFDNKTYHLVDILVTKEVLCALIFSLSECNSSSSNKFSATVRCKMTLHPSFS